MPGKTPNLRPYQEKAKCDLRKAHISGHRQILLNATTGSGKTVIFSDIVRGAIASGSRALVLVHRWNILDQIVRTLSRYNLNPGVIQGNNYWTDSKVHVAMVQSLARRMDVMKNLKILPDVIIVDEAHHCTSPTYMMIIAYILKHKPGSVILGFTATPERTDGVGLDKAGYTKMIDGPQYVDLLNTDYTGGETYLCEPVLYYSPTTAMIEAQKGKIKNGEYDQETEEEIFSDGVIVNDTILEYKKHFNGAPAIIFCCSVNDCNTVSDQMKAAGWSGGVVSDKVDRDIQKKLISGLGDGTYNFICSFDIISEGTDIPVVAGIIIRRRTKSLINYLQWAGRSARRYPGKLWNIIIDQAGVSKQKGFGHPLTRRKFSLKGREEREKDEQEEMITSICPHCNALLAGKPNACRFCGCPLGAYTVKNYKPMEHIIAPMEIMPAPVCDDTEVMAEVEEAEDPEVAAQEAIAQGRLARAKLVDIAHRLGKTDKWLEMALNQFSIEP